MHIIIHVHSGLLIRKPLFLCYIARVNCEGTVAMQQGITIDGDLCNNIAFKNLLLFNLVHNELTVDSRNFYWSLKKTVSLRAWRNTFIFVMNSINEIR